MADEQSSFEILQDLPTEHLLSFVVKNHLNALLLKIPASILK